MNIILIHSRHKVWCTSEKVCDFPVKLELFTLILLTFSDGYLFVVRDLNMHRSEYIKRKGKNAVYKQLHQLLRKRPRSMWRLWRRKFKFYALWDIHQASHIMLRKVVHNKPFVWAIPCFRANCSFIVPTMKYAFQRKWKPGTRLVKDTPYEGQKLFPDVHLLDEV